MKKYYLLGFLFFTLLLLTPIKSVFAMDISILSTFILQEKSGYVCSDSISCSSLNSIYNINVSGDDTYICSGNSSYCSNSNSLYKAKKQSDGTYYICSGSDIYCSYINKIYQIKKYSSDTTYICDDSISCSSLSDLYKIKQSSSDNYYICSGDSISCSSLSDIYRVKKTTTNVYVCDGDDISCSSLNYLYKFSPEDTSSPGGASISNNDYLTSILCTTNSYYKDGYCYCNPGYQLNSSKDKCEAITCPDNSHLINNQCVCDSGHLMRNNSCITNTEDCQLKYGANIYGIANNSGSSDCFCNSGYVFDGVNNKCIQEIKKTETVTSNSFIESEKAKLGKIDNALSSKLKGRILLQVEDLGQAWYVNPKDEKRYYMADGNEAYKIMRELGIGITNNNLEKIKNDKIFAKQNSGKIFLQVEDLGQAYYIDFDGNYHYLKDGNEAYNIMKELGLGIKNSYIRTIDIK